MGTEVRHHKALQLRDDLNGVLPAQNFRQIGVLHSDGLDQPIMLVYIARWQAVIEAPVIEAEEPHAFVQQAGEKLGIIGILPGSGDGKVKIAVGV